MFRDRQLLLILCVTAAASACEIKKGDGPTAPSPLPTPNSPIFYTAIGASDTWGIGSSVECPSYTDCPNGMGYVPVATRQLRSQGFTVTLSNLGIPTAVIGRDFQSLGLQYNRTILGNLIDGEAPFVPANTTLVTIFAGANDVNTITAALGGGAGATDQAGFIDSQVRAFGVDYATLLAAIRARAPSTRIIVLNLPNLAGLPYLTSASLPQRQAAQRASVGMTTTVINPLVAQGVTVIDLMCDARAYQASTYSSDGFHPSDTGYAFIAAEVVRAAITSYPAPTASCSRMNVVP